VESQVEGVQLGSEVSSQCTGATERVLRRDGVASLLGEEYVRGSHCEWIVREGWIGNRQVGIRGSWCAEEHGRYETSMTRDENW
jgi:hypothetical protein